MAKKFLKNYGFLIFMLTGIVAGCIVGAIFPAVKDAQGNILEPGARVLEPLGTVFINLMFCIVVPMVFCSIASAVANMESMKRPVRSWVSPLPLLWSPPVSPLSLCM